MLAGAGLRGLSEFRILTAYPSEADVLHRIPCHVTPDALRAQVVLRCIYRTLTDIEFRNLVRLRRQSKQ
jgi:hypothetical protein